MDVDIVMSQREVFAAIVVDFGVALGDGLDDQERKEIFEQIVKMLDLEYGKWVHFGAYAFPVMMKLT